MHWGCALICPYFGAVVYRMRVYIHHHWGYKKFAFFLCVKSSSCELRPISYLCCNFVSLLYHFSDLEDVIIWRKIKNWYVEQHMLWMPPAFTTNSRRTIVWMLLSSHTKYKIQAVTLTQKMPRVYQPKDTSLLNRPRKTWYFLTTSPSF